MVWDRGPAVGAEGELVGVVRLDVGANPQPGSSECRVLDYVMARRVTQGVGELPLAASTQWCGEDHLGFKALQLVAVHGAVYDLEA